MDEKLKFITQIKKNLELNGFPDKKVSFDLEKMYELADTKGFSFNAIIDQLKQEKILIELTTEKVIFSTEEEILVNDQNMFQQAQEMLAKMSPEEIQKMKEMYENMSDKQREEIMEQAKKSGMI